MARSTSTAATYPETNPAVPYEVDAQLFNLGNAPLMLSAFSSDSTPNTETDYTVVPAKLNTPACSSSTSGLPGGLLFGLQLLTATPPAEGRPTDCSRRE